MTIDPEVAAELALMREELVAKEDFDAFTGDVDTSWLIVMGAFVFFMQLGFAMVEAGTIRFKNVNNILFKNILDASLGAIVFFVFGFAFAYGDDEDSSFIGGANFALADNEDFIGFFFQWAFAATAATIVSGSVAERTKISAYFIYSVCITGFIYPVVVHWVWDNEGWLNGFNTNEDGSMWANYASIDFAGSGVVHMVGGFAGLAGAIVVGPRVGFKVDEEVHVAYSSPLQVLGTMILWFGWYGFNCGSTLAISGAMGIGSRVAVTTTLGAASGCIASVLCSRATNSASGTGANWDLARACNGALAGLVSITAGCAVVTPGWSIVIGLIGGCIYFGSTKLVRRFGVDDPLDAFSVHGAAGFWGVIAVAIFAREEVILMAYPAGMSDIDTGKRFRNQFVEALAVAAWTLATSGVMFLAIKYTVGIRVDKDHELAGLDSIEHGGQATNHGPPTPSGSVQLGSTLGVSRDDGAAK